ncbi:MAG: hypothetical protein ABSG25_06565, partial [Bryobacteraceae bacterium]
AANSNLFVADPFGLRVMVFTPSTLQLPVGAVVNAASLEVPATGNVTISGAPNTGDVVTITINNVNYTYTVGDYTKGVPDTLANGGIEYGLAAAINAKSGDPSVIATVNVATFQVILTARTPGPNGNAVVIAASVTLASGDTSGTTATASGITLTGGDAAGTVAPGGLVVISGPMPSGTPCTTTPSSNPQALPCVVDQDATAPPALETASCATVPLPGTAVNPYCTTTPYAPLPSMASSVGGVEVYFDGVRAPVISVTTEQHPVASPSATVSPTPIPAKITAQVPFELAGRASASVVVRTVHANDPKGAVTVTSATGVPIASSNPGLFAQQGSDPRAVFAYHKFGTATGFIYVQNFPTTGDIATVTINGETVNDPNISDTTSLNAIRDALIGAINGDPSMPVVALAGGGPGSFIELVAKPNQPNNGNDIVFTASNTSTATTLGVSLSASNPTLCGGLTPAGGPIQAGDLVTATEPATAGEIITVYGTGLGLVNAVLPVNLPPTTDATPYQPATGFPFRGDPGNWPNDFVSAFALFAGATGGTSSFAILSSGLVTEPLPPEVAAAAGTSQGVYRIDLGLDPRLASNDSTQFWLAQNGHNSNIVTMPVAAQ